MSNYSSYNGSEDKALSTSQALKRNIEESDAGAGYGEFEGYEIKKPVADLKTEANPEKIKTTTAEKKECISKSKPKRLSAFKGHGNLEGLYIYSLLKKFPNCKFGSDLIMQELLSAIDDQKEYVINPEKIDDDDQYQKVAEFEARNTRRICDALSVKLFGEMKYSYMSRLIKDVCGGVIKKDKIKGKNYYYYKGEESPAQESEYVTDRKVVLRLVGDEFDKIYETISAEL